MIQIRNVPDTLHRRLKSRAALAGMSLSDYLMNEIPQLAERPTLDELHARFDPRRTLHAAHLPRCRSRAGGRAMFGE
jgi:antitoxin FitA